MLMSDTTDQDDEVEGAAHHEGAPYLRTPQRLRPWRLCRLLLTAARGFAPIFGPALRLGRAPASDDAVADTTAWRPLHATLTPALNLLPQGKPSERVMASLLDARRRYAELRESLDRDCEADRELYRELTRTIRVLDDKMAFSGAGAGSDHGPQSAMGAAQFARHRNSR